MPGKNSTAACGISAPITAMALVQDITLISLNQNLSTYFNQRKNNLTFIASEYLSTNMIKKEYTEGLSSQ